MFSFITGQSLFAQNNVSPSTLKELEDAETKMFKGMVNHDPAYYKDYVSEDYITINADGVMANKVETWADSAKTKFMAAFTTKLVDKKIRVYGPVGIITGRARAYMKDTYAVEFLYTATFVKQNDKWMFTGWQGTISKDSPKPPSGQ